MVFNEQINKVFKDYFKADLKKYTSPDIFVNLFR